MVNEIIQKQNKYYQSGQTRPIQFRISQLRQLKQGIIQYENEIKEALKMDLGKSEFEAYATEIGFTLDSISTMCKHLKRWAKSKRVVTPIHQLFAKSFIQQEPYGTVLIVAPYNYPFQLLIEPLIGAIAAGNTVVLKPSEYTINTERIIKKLIQETFEDQYIQVVTGGVEVTAALFSGHFDYIFFTGSVPVGKIVMKAAAENLIPITLELGGKSPTIVHKDANIKMAAKRITWGKFMNAGQTCVAPDYVYVHEDVAEVFFKELAQTIRQFYGEEPKESLDYGRIVNERHFNRLINLLDTSQILLGGEADLRQRYIAPTVLKDVSWTDAVMADEIFGPILPVMTYQNLEEIIPIIISKPKPLAAYFFTESKALQKYLLNRISFGGGCVNDTISHVASASLPFGGVGSSGIGAYHGKASFLTFSHAKSIIQKSTKVDIKLAFPPYKNHLKFVKMLLK